MQHQGLHLPCRASKPSVLTLRHSVHLATRPAAVPCQQARVPQSKLYTLTFLTTHLQHLSKRNWTGIGRFHHPAQQQPGPTLVCTHCCHRARQLRCWSTATRNTAARQQAAAAANPSRAAAAAARRPTRAKRTRPGDTDSCEWPPAAAPIHHATTPQCTMHQLNAPGQMQTILAASLGPSGAGAHTLGSAACCCMLCCCCWCCTCRSPSLLLVMP